MNSSEKKQKGNKDNKELNIDKIKVNELKNKIKYRNNSSSNIYLTQKKESSSFNETDIKLVYLNKFLNLPYAPIEAFSYEQIK